MVGQGGHTMPRRGLGLARAWGWCGPPVAPLRLSFWAASLVPAMKRALDDGKVEEGVVPAVADLVQKVEEVVVPVVADPPQERRQFIVDVFFDEDEWPPRNGPKFDEEVGYEEEEVNTLDLKFLYTS